MANALNIEQRLHCEANSTAISPLLLGQQHPQRASLEQFIQQGFAHSYQAQVQQFMPHLLALSDGQHWQATLGIRHAACQPLFVEHYIDSAMEQHLEQHGIHCPRSELLEIGHLYSVNRRATLMLFVLLASLTEHLQASHLVCCATPAVQLLLRSGGLEIVDLGIADSTRLGADASLWGSYYQSAPHLIYLNLQHAYHIIDQNPRLNAIPKQHWPALHRCLAEMAATPQCQI